MKYHIQKKKKRILLVLQLKAIIVNHVIHFAETSRASFSRNLESKCNIIEHQNITKKKTPSISVTIKIARGQWRGRDQVPVSLDDIFFQTPNRGSSPHLANSYICHFVNPY